MILNATTATAADLMHAWRRQIGHRHAIAMARGPRPFAVLAYRVRGPLLENRYIHLRHLTLVALFDDRTRRDLSTRLVGVGGCLDANGLRFGGVELARFDKDVRLAPARGRLGAHLDTTDQELLNLALSLERFLERCARHPFMPRRRVPRLPVLKEGGVPHDACLVDLSVLPKRQVVAITSPERDLIGHSGTSVFDFVNTRFRASR